MSPPSFTTDSFRRRERSSCTGRPRFAIVIASLLTLRASWTLTRPLLRSSRQFFTVLQPTMKISDWIATRFRVNCDFRVSALIDFSARWRGTSMQV